MKKGWPAQVAILLSHIRKMLWDIVGVKIHSHMISQFLTCRSAQWLKLDRGIRECRSFASLRMTACNVILSEAKDLGGGEAGGPRPLFPVAPPHLKNNTPPRPPPVHSLLPLRCLGV